METKQTSPFFIKIKGIAKKLLSAYRACTRLVMVHFQEKLTSLRCHKCQSVKVLTGTAHVLTGDGILGERMRNLNNYKKQRLRYLFFTDYFVTLYPALRI